MLQVCPIIMIYKPKETPHARRPNIAGLQTEDRKAEKADMDEFVRV